MSIKINLHFRKIPNIELLNKGIELPAIRVMAWVRFKIDNNWSWYYEAIIDTGAPASLIPPKIWQQVEHEIETSYLIRGIVPKQECTLSVNIGRVAIIIFDEYTESNPIFIRAHLSHTDDVPLILGFHNLLEYGKFCINYPDKKAWIEI